MKHNLSFIVPVYNEADNLKFVYDDIMSLDLLKQGTVSSEIVFVNDGSTDNTSEVLVELMSHERNVKGITLPANKGKSAAIIEGVKSATGDTYVIMDGDGQVRAVDIKSVIDKILNGDIDIVLGSKYSSESSNKEKYTRQIFGRVYNWVIKVLLGYGLTDVQSGLKGIKATSFNQLMPLDAKGFDFDLKFISKAIRYGMDISEVPIGIQERHSGLSKVNKFKTSFILLRQIIEYVIRDHFDPKIIAGNYQYRALHKGSRMQRFWHSHKIELVKALIRFKESDVLLDAGCGSGNLCFALAGLCDKVYGVDAFDSAISFADKQKKRLNLMNCYFEHAPLDKIPHADGTFDKVFMMDVIEHLHNVDAVLAEIRRVLKKDGEFIIVTPNYGSYWKLLESLMDVLNLAPKLKDYQHVNPYNIETLTKSLNKARLTIDKMGTFYGISPFMAKISMNYADRLFRNELKVNFNRRALIYCVAILSDNS